MGILSDELKQLDTIPAAYVVIIVPGLVGITALMWREYGDVYPSHRPDSAYYTATILSSRCVAIPFFIVGSFVWPLIASESHQPGILIAHVPGSLPEWFTLLCFYFATYMWGQAASILFCYYIRKFRILLSLIVFLPFFLMTIVWLFIGVNNFLTPGYNIAVLLVLWLLLAIISFLSFIGSVALSFTRPVGITPTQRWTPTNKGIANNQQYPPRNTGYR